MKENLSSISFRKLNEKCEIALLTFLLLSCSSEASKPEAKPVKPVEKAVIAADKPLPSVPKPKPTVPAVAGTVNNYSKCLKFYWKEESIDFYDL